MKWIWDFGSLGTLEQCGKLAGGGSVAVAVGLSDKGHVTYDTWIIFHLLPFCLFLSVSFHHGIGASIPTHSGVQCLLDEVPLSKYEVHINERGWSGKKF